jgi:hypothetical protein
MANSFIVRTGTSAVANPNDTGNFTQIDGTGVIRTGATAIVSSDIGIPDTSPTTPPDAATVAQHGGKAVQADPLAAENAGVVCFTRGTLIQTALGEIPIEDLALGDLVLTTDHGYQPIRWIGSTTVAGRGRFAPIRIAKGILGNRRALTVSPQHRLLLAGWQADLLFDEAEVLVAAKLLVNDSTIRIFEVEEVEYFHLLFDAHEIIYAEGCPSESFHPGQVGWGALAEAARAEILALFPQLSALDFTAYGPSARRSLSAAEARVARAAMFPDEGRHAAE